MLPRFQWQRIALARAFMRAHQPEVHFLLFDEPVRPSFIFPSILINNVSRMGRPPLSMPTPRTKYFRRLIQSPVGLAQMGTPQK